MQKKARALTRAGVIAAAYVALSLLSSLVGLAYGPVQLRLSEALCVLPFLFPEATLGLFVGCLVSNIISPYGLLDLIVGSLATLLAGAWTRRCRCSVLAPLPPVVCNALAVGALIAFEQTGAGEAFPAAFALNALSVGAGEALVCYAAGLPLLHALSRRHVHSRAASEKKEP